MFEGGYMQNQNNKQTQPELGTKKFNPQANPNHMNQGSDAQGKALNQKGQNSNQQGQNFRDVGQEADQQSDSDASMNPRSSRDSAQLGEQATRQGKLSREQISKDEEEINVERASDKDVKYNTETWAKNDSNNGRDNMKPGKSGGV